MTTKKEKVLVEEVKETTTDVKDATVVVQVSELDSQIQDRMKSQPQSLSEIDIKSTLKDQGMHLLSLPKELEPYSKDYAFYWVGKDKRKIDRALDVRGWVIVNRALFPKLPKHLFSISGAMERGDAILCCMSSKKAELLRKTPQERSAELLKATLDKPKTHPDMYEAKLSTSEENEENPKGFVVES
jgi:hypothetical protein